MKKFTTLALATALGFSALFTGVNGAEASTHIVDKNQTVYSIIKANNLTLAAFMELNPKVDINKIKVGQELTVSVEEEAKTTHIVASGETAYKIAKMYGLTFAELQQFNSGINLNKLKVGQEISIVDERDNRIFGVVTSYDSKKKIASFKVGKETKKIIIPSHFASEVKKLAKNKESIEFMIEETSKGLSLVTMH